MDASAIDATFLLSKILGSGNTEQGTEEASASGQERRSEATAEPANGDTSPQGDLEEELPAFDAVFTNAALHWVRAPRTVIDGAKRVLRPGGRFVGEFGGHGNMAAVRVAMHAALWRRGLDPLQVDPWYFPTPDEYRRQLEEVSARREKGDTANLVLVAGLWLECRDACPCRSSLSFVETASGDVSW